MPNKSTQHVDQLLSNVSVKYKPTGLIASSVFPEVQVKKDSDLFRQYTRNFRIPDTRRANKGVAHEHQFAVANGSYVLETHALKDYVSDDDEDNYDINSLKADTVEELTDKIMLRMEKSVADLFTTTNWSQNVSLAAGSDFASNTTTSNPIPVFDTASTTIINNGGVTPNFGVIPRAAFTAIKNHVSILDRVKYTSQEMTVEMLAGLFDLEQILVLLPQLISVEQGTIVANTNTQQNYKGAYLSFNLNINLPPPCTTGFLPSQQQRTPTEVDYPDRVAGDLYCRTPQDSPFNVRGVRNTPCETKPGKRAPTVAMCESDEQYVPLNDGYNWKGDPNATMSGQDIPQLPPGAAPANPNPPTAPPPPALIGVTEYDPATGTYVAPNGRQYTQTDLAQPAKQDNTWQSMLLPPGS